MNLTKRELATTLGALRLMQDAIEDGRIPAELQEIFQDGGYVEPLTVLEIDALCERLNTETML